MYSKQFEANCAMVNRGQQGDERAQWSIKAAWLSPTGVEVGGGWVVTVILPSEVPFERLLGRQMDHEQLPCQHLTFRR